MHKVSSDGRREKKRFGDPELRLDSIPEEKPSTVKTCLSCQQACLRVKRCRDCKSGCYCSKVCRESHVPTEAHQDLCPHIQKLAAMEKAKQVFSVRETSQVNGRVRRKLVKLVGEKPMVVCSLNGVDMEVLWDTGAMVSMVNRKWLQENHPDLPILSVMEFLEGDELHLCTANNSKIAVEGVVVMAVNIGNSSITVPFVVSTDELAQPIIGYNLIKAFVESAGNESSALLRLSCPFLTNSRANAVVNLIQAETSEEIASTATRTIIPPRSRYKVRCRTGFQASELNQSVFVSPILLGTELEVAESVATVRIGRQIVHIVVSNPTDEPIVLEKNSPLASVEPVSAVIPLMVLNPSKVKTGSLTAEALSVQTPQHTTSHNHYPVSSVSLAEEGGANEQTQGDDDPQNIDDWLPPVDLSHLTEQQRLVAEKILREESGVFSRGKDDQGDVPDMEMEIHLKDDVPVVVPHRQLPRQLYEEVKNFINDLVKRIRESTSNYSSPIVCARKKSGALRLCIDYRLLNQKIIPDKMPIPRIQELLDGLGGQVWFSTLDMSNAYFQGYVKEEFRKLTAFSTPWALYEWIRIPQGISNSPPVFQRYINGVLQGLRDLICTAYLDDILIYGKSFEAHAANLKSVLARLKSRGIKLEPTKCHLFRTEIRYLGRLLSKDGHRPDPADAEAIEKFREVPKSVGDLRSKLGFLGYYRSYIKDFSQKFQPMYQLLQGNILVHGKKKSKVAFSRQPIAWTQEMQDTVDDVIDYLKSPGFLAFPDWNIPFTLHVDASQKGLGAVLYQKIDNKDRVISFASRTLTPPEQKYHLHSGKLEFLALEWAITDKFSDYLSFGPPFTVYTDNNPLTYVMTTAKLNATGLRWVATLSN